MSDTMNAPTVAMRLPEMAPVGGLSKSQRHMLRDLGSRTVYTVPYSQMANDLDGAQVRVSAWLAAWQEFHRGNAVVSRYDDDERQVVVFTVEADR